jgi:hypothetical protein
MAAYVDYTYYTNTYGGTSIPSAAFSRLALLASAFIDRVTFGRAAETVAEDTDTELIEKIDYAVCAVAEEMYSYEQNGAQVASERVGQYSVSYVQNKQFTRTQDQKQVEAAKLFLGSTGLMYGGFYADEYGSDPL